MNLVRLSLSSNTSFTFLLSPPHLLPFLASRIAIWWSQVFAQSLNVPHHFYLLLNFLDLECYIYDLWGSINCICCPGLINLSNLHDLKTDPLRVEWSINMVWLSPPGKTEIGYWGPCRAKEVIWCELQQIISTVCLLFISNPSEGRQTTSWSELIKKIR